MTLIGFHASHEQIHPARLLSDVRHAAEAGFAFGMSSDHFAPWSARQGHSGFAWSWLGAAMATTDLPFGVVNAPGQRYHPAIVAQAMATLSAMFPERLWVALGSGQALNEHVTGEVWPRKAVRNARLRECVDVIRALLAGEEVSHDGLVTVDRARLWTLPEVPPTLIGAAVGVETAAWVAEWADGMVTINQPHEHLRRMVDAYRSNGGRGPLRLQVHLSWHPDEAVAMALAREQWRSNVLPPDACWDLGFPELFDAVTEHVSDEVVRRSVQVGADLGQHAEWVAEYAALGFDEIALHHVGQEQTGFIETFGERVLPELAGVLA